MPHDMDFDVQPAVRGLSLSGEPLPHFDEPIRSPVGTTPPRRPGSVRRTMSIDVHWPEGDRGPGHYHGRARDILTPPGADGTPPAPVLLGEAEARLVIADRRIATITAQPSPPRLQQLVGLVPRGELRRALAADLAEEKAAGTLLYLMLDDLAGAALVGGWAISTAGDPAGANAQRERPRAQMEGVCMGFRPGSSSLDPAGPRGRSNTSRVVPLPNPLDPAGWHALPEHDGPTFRRARRIEVWREGAELIVETHFQDSASAPDGGLRQAIHEYLLRARIGADGVVQAIETTPGTLPFPSCRAAPVNNAVLIGTPARALRETVLDRLRLTSGCTHLNDTLRSLAETEVLAAHLPG